MIIRTENSSNIIIRQLIPFIKKKILCETMIQINNIEQRLNFRYRETEFNVNTIKV